MSERVPEGWESKRLGDFIKLQGGNAFQSSNFRDSGIPIVRISNIRNDKIDLSDAVYYKKSTVYEKFLVANGDILLAMSGATTGKIGRYLLPFQSYLNQRVGRFQKIENKSVCMDFIYQLVRSRVFSENTLIDAIGGAQPNISSSQVEGVFYKIPPLPEQKKIASILTSVDEVIENTQKQIDKLQDLKKATMNELLTKGIGHTEFKDSELGRIPKSWEVSRIGLYLNEFGQKSKQNDEYEVFTSSSKGLVKQSDYYGENRLTRRGNIGFNIIPERYITYRSRTDSNKFFFNQNNLNATGLVSKYYPVFTHKKGVEFNHFITSLLNFHSQKFANEGVGTSQVVLSFNALKFVKLAMPSLNEQLEIAEIISGVDENLRFMSKKLSQTQSLKKSLMQDLLTAF